MANLVMAYSNTKYGHITDDPDGGPIKTRCGRTLKHYSYGHTGEHDCPNCGTPEDYEVIREEGRRQWLEAKRRREEENKRREVWQAQRLEQHRAIMATVRDMLLLHGATVLDEQQREAGGQIEFELDDLKFKLSGTIWK